MSNWRYQPVWIEQEGEKYYGLCEVYFDAADRLEKWTENTSIAPGGITWGELTGDLTMMLADAYRWRPVDAATLAVGMTFERLLSEEHCEAIAKMIEQWTHNMETARGP